MKIFDMHIHAENREITPEKMLSSMNKAGVYGGCVFSHMPKTGKTPQGTSFDERLNEALAWSNGHEDRIFPVLWIDPYEENIIENLHRAKDAGIAAIKIICNDFYIYEEGALAVVKEIARLGLPIIFHTGILWDGETSSNYNRPLNWEPLLHIDGLKFSLGHCSWPWIDECVALYGKFLNALTNGKTAEMFFDITPGTPEIYRKELFTKLYALGYNVGDNVMFGTDGTADNYRDKWAKHWLDLDGKILDELGVSLENREKLYCGNLMRFLGKSNYVPKKEAPVPDDTCPWSPVNPEVKVIIQKWYEKLNFPKNYDAQFKKAIREIEISDAITLENYDLTCEDGKRNLLSFLFLCEGLAKRYEDAGIPENILLDTLKDLPIWTIEWSNVKGSLHLGELDWLKKHMDMNLFRLGRLQFSPAKCHYDVPEFGIKKGDDIMEVHIPTGDKLNTGDCLESIEMAKIFFEKYFPDYKYSYFTCHSWLLDETLRKYLPEESNILAFGDLFKKVHEDDSLALIRYIFRWDTTKENLPHSVCNSSFAEKIKKAVMKGETFHETFGVILK